MTSAADERAAVEIEAAAHLAAPKEGK